MAQYNPLVALSQSLQGSQKASDVSPSQAFGEAFQQANQMQQVADQTAAVQAMQQDLNNRTSALLSKPIDQRSASDYADLAMLMPPEQAKVVQESWTSIDKAKQNESLGVAGKVMALDSSGNSDTASAILQSHAEKARNNKDYEQAAYWEKMAEASPEQRSLSLGTTMSLLPEGSKLLETLQKTNELRINNATLEDRNQMSMRKDEAAIAKNKSDIGATSSSERIQNVKRNVELADLNKQISTIDGLMKQAEQYGSNLPEWAQGIGQTAKRITGVNASDPAEKFKQDYRIVREKAKTALFKGQGSISDAERVAFEKLYPAENAPIDLIKSSLAAMKGRYEIDKQALETVTPSAMGASNVGVSGKSESSRAIPSIFHKY
jgi:hypothetical protein